MRKTISTRAMVLGGVAIAAMLGVLAAQPMVKAQDDGAASIVAGSYNPQSIAQQIGLEQQLMAEMGGLQQRMMEAQQNGDQDAMQQIQIEAQQIQEDIVGKFETDMEAAMPEVAAEAGVQMIAIEISWTAPGVETKDITQDIVDALGGPAAPQAPPEFTIPAQ